MIDQRIYTFISLVRIGNYTRTAELLNITQPAVTQHIKYLEEYYKVSLFKKNGRILELTEEGETLFEYAKKLEMLSNELEKAMYNKTSIVKTYVIGATRTIGGYVLPSILGEYKKRNKNIDIILSVKNNEEIIADLVERKIELAYVEGPFDRNKFVYEKFKDDELVLAVSSDSHLMRRKEVSIKDLLIGNLILREKGSGTRKIFENALIEAGLNIEDIKAYMEIGSISAIKALVESNLGYTIISRETIKKELILGTINILPIKGMVIGREFNIIYNADTTNMDFVQGLIKFSKEMVKIIY